MNSTIFSTLKYKGMRGFTLVELLISMAIFTSVITIATGALFSAQTINSRLEQTQIILDGVNLATEVMVRDIRYGSEFRCDTVIPTAALPTTRASCEYDNGGTVIIFKPTLTLPASSDPQLDRISYYLSEGVVYKDEYREGNINNKVTYQITPSDVDIETLTFYIAGAESTTDTNFIQPLVTIVLSGVTVPQRTSVEPVVFKIQTSVSARPTDI